jgi:BirA family biotin operon repressor/biotin-[acetyl-CoA-carboxylase] ligase
MPGRILSGQALAGRLGVSRTAVWKQIQALKDVGLPIESTGRQGYRFTAPFDNSLVSFRGPRGTTPHYFLSTVSTQSLAKAGAEAGLSEGHLWISETQTKGRGRLDRFWESNYGGLWFSLLLRPTLPPARMAPLTLLAGLSLRQAVNKVCHVDAKLKWPNDLLIESRGAWLKCAGILTEMSGQMERTEWMVVGVGLNVNNVLSDELADRAISLYRKTDRVWSRSDILETFLIIFFKNYRRFLKEGFVPFRQPYWKNYFAPARRMRLKTASGMITGKARGVDAGGGIMIESRRKMSSFIEGEIVL